jgi:hypothetical protein
MEKPTIPHPIQAAIDKAGSSAHEGLVFIPSGRYRLTRTLYVWPGVRVIGYGPTRPIFLLAAPTPGFQKGVAVMVMFTGANSAEPGPRRPPGSLSASGICTAQQRRRRCRTQHLLLGHEQHRFRNRRRQPSRRRHPLPRRPARLSQPHGLPHRLRPSRAHPNRQRSRGPAFLRRTLRHPHRKNLARLAIHAHRFHLRRPARRRYPRA